MYWRIHEKIIGERSAELTDIISGYGDTIQLINSHDVAYLPACEHTYATYLTTIRDARNAPHTFTSWYDNSSYSVNSYTSNYSRDIPFLNRDGVFLTVAQVTNLNWMVDFATKMWGSTSVFIRPVSGSKVFTGQVVDIIDTSMVKFILRSMSNEDIISVSSAKHIDPIEWRFWIFNKRIVTYTPYSWFIDEEEVAKLAFDHHIVASVVNAVQQIADDEFQVADTYVVDACVNRADGKPYILEINCTNTSGLYNAPLQPIIENLRSLVISTYDQFYE